MSERKAHAYAITLGLRKDLQGKVTAEDLQKKMDSIIKALRRKQGWTFYIDWVVSDTSFTTVKDLEKQGKIYDFSPFGFELNNLDEIEKYREEWTTPLHVHIALYANPGQSAKNLIVSFWERHGLGVESGEHRSIDVKYIFNYAGWKEYLDGNYHYSAKRGGCNARSRDLIGKDIEELFTNLE